MSLYDDASLIMYPSGVKASKIYSQKPTNGSGDLTFSRASTATRVNSSGLIEKVRENLLLQSNQFDTTWATTDSSVTSGQVGYDGSSDAWLFETTVSGATVQQSFSSTGVLTFSVYAKAGSVNGIRLRIDAATDANGYYNLLNGTVFSSIGIDATIADVGNGWYKCSLSHNISSPVKVQFFTTDGTTSYDNGNIYIQDAQLEVGLVATDYIETTTTTAVSGITEDLPRLDYSGGASCPSLLLEPQRTNKLPYSEYFEGAASGTITLEGGYLAPDGTNSAYKITVTDLSLAYLVYVGISLADDSRSIYARSVSGTGTAQLLSHNSNTNNTFTLTEQWQRFELNSAPLVSDNFYAVDFRGGGTLTELIIWGAQCEVGSYPTSYIPTYGTSQTRSDDACNTGSLLSTFDDSQGVLFAEFNPSFPEASSRQITINDATYSNRIIIEVRESGTKIKALVLAAGSAEFESTKNISVVDTTYKVAVKYSATDTAFFVNGEKVSSSTGTIAMPTGLKHLSFTGRYNDNSLAFESRTKQLSYFPTALTDSECIALTS